MKRWIKILALGGTCLVAIALIGLKVAASLMLTPARAVAKLEEEFNLRAEVDSVEAHLFRVPARVAIKGIRLAPRDASIETGYADRTPLEPGSAPVLISGAELEVGLFSLLTGKLEVDRLAVTGISARADLRKDGTNTLEVLFADPDPEAEDEAADESDPEKKKKKEPKVRDKVYASSLPLPASLKEATLEGEEIAITVEKTGAQIIITDLRAAFSDIDIDPGDLANHNAVQGKITGKIAVDSSIQGLRYTEILTEVSGDIRPFIPESGELAPKAELVASAKAGSWVASLPTFEKLAGTLEQLRQIGLKLEGLADKNVLENDANLNLDYFEQKFTLQKQVGLTFRDFDLLLKGESWVSVADSMHEFKGFLTASEALSDKAVGGAEEFLADNFGTEAAALARSAALEPLLTDGRIELKFTSEEDIGRPKVRLANPLKELGDSLKDVGKKFLEGLLNR